MTWHGEQEKDARISFFPKRPERRRETERPISEKVLKSREREGGGGSGDVEVLVESVKAERRLSSISLNFHTPTSKPRLLAPFFCDT